MPTRPFLPAPSSITTIATVFENGRKLQPIIRPFWNRSRIDTNFQAISTVESLPNLRKLPRIYDVWSSGFASCSVKSKSEEQSTALRVF
jgi:hypothetical protein